MQDQNNEDTEECKDEAIGCHVKGLENWSTGPDMDLEGPMESRIKAHISIIGATVSNNIYKDIENFSEPLFRHLRVMAKNIDDEFKITNRKLSYLDKKIDAQLTFRKSDKAIWFSIGVMFICSLNFIATYFNL